MSNKKKIKIHLSIIILFFSSVVSAVNFDITPLTTLPTTYNENESVNAFYKVTNTSNQTLTAYIKRIPPNTSQSMFDGSVSTICQNPFSLAPNASCHLKLTVNGPIDSTDINQHLWICLTNSTSTCNAPATQLNITETPISAVTINTVTYPASQDFLYTNTSTSVVPDADSHLTLSATLSYPSGYTINATNVQWISDRPDLVTISNTGVAQAQKLPGIAHIKARTLTHLGYVESQSVIVRVKRRIVDIEIIGTKNTMHPTNENQTLNAYAIFADGTRQILINDNNLKWVSNTPYITIGQYTGIVTASCPSNTILPSDRPITEISAEYTPAAIINKTKYKITFQSDVTSIDAITPSEKFIYIGENSNLVSLGRTECSTATSSFNISPYVEWASDDGTIATVNNTNEKGKISALTSGSTSIHAVYGAQDLLANIKTFQKPTSALIGIVDRETAGNSTPNSTYIYYCSLKDDLTLNTCTSTNAKPTINTENYKTFITTNKIFLANNKLYAEYRYFWQNGNWSLGREFISMCDQSSNTFNNCSTYLEIWATTSPPNPGTITETHVDTILSPSKNNFYLLFKGFDDNINNNKIKKCPVSSSPNPSCTTISLSNIWIPLRFTLSPDGTNIYILTTYPDPYPQTWRSTKRIYKCPINNDETIGTCIDSGLGDFELTKIGYVNDLKISPNGLRLYISANVSYIVCERLNNNVNDNFQPFSACKRIEPTDIYGSTWFTTPGNIFLDPVGKILFAARPSRSTYNPSLVYCKTNDPPLSPLTTPCTGLNSTPNVFIPNDTVPFTLLLY